MQVKQKNKIDKEELLEEIYQKIVGGPGSLIENRKLFEWVRDKVWKHIPEPKTTPPCQKQH